MRKILTREHSANSCYFRSSVQSPYRKALLQITEKCNLHCAHCFVSAGNHGNTMDFQDIRGIVTPKLKQSNVESVTLTGGEPFLCPDITSIVSLLIDNDIRVTICTNATVISDRQIKDLSKINNVKINVSLDGLNPESHGVFRGNKHSFITTIETTQTLGEYGLLNGLLVTPNNLASVEEYAGICDFAANNGAKYVLMNPLSKFGRGAESQCKLGCSNYMMKQIKEACAKFSDRIEIVYIRFPNTKLPLSSCEAGNIFYIFTSGAVAVCPYMVFAAQTYGSKHKPEEFIVANIFSDEDINDALTTFKSNILQYVGCNNFCKICHLEANCGKGCPAAIIASGQKINGIDIEICPIVDIT